MIEIWLPFPPSANNIFSQTRAGRRFPAKKYVAWRRHADLLLMASKIRTRSVPCIIEIELTPPTKAKRDADNYVKPVLDALVRMRVIADDSRAHLREVRVRWTEGDRPGALVRITDAMPVQKRRASKQPTLLDLMETKRQEAA